MTIDREVAKQVGQLFHTEIRSSNPSATAAFVANVLGWTVVDTPSPSHKIFETPGGFEGHIGPVPETDIGPSAINYVRVSDIAKAEEKIVNSGGSIVVPRQEAPGRGLYTWFEMPGGIQMVAWQDLNT